MGIWLFIVYYKMGFTYSHYDKRLYILTKQDDGYYRSLGFRIHEKDYKLISYNTLMKYFNIKHLFHLSQIQENTIINKRNKVDFMFVNRILISGCEEVKYYKKLHLNKERLKKLNEGVIYLVDEFTKDIRKT